MTWVNLEQLSAWHNVPLATKDNGLDGFDTELKFNGPLHVKHLENLVELQKDKTYDYSGRTNTGEGRFTSRRMRDHADLVGVLRQRQGERQVRLRRTRRCRTTPTSQGAPQNSIIGGASLWVMGGKKPEEYKGVAKFFTFLSDTDRQVRAAQGIGLPADHHGGLREDQGSRASTRRTPISRRRCSSSPTRSRPRTRAGLRLGNFVQMRDVWDEEIEAALAGKKTAKAGARRRGQARQRSMLRQFERTVTR